MWNTLLGRKSLLASFHWKINSWLFYILGANLQSPSKGELLNNSWPNLAPLEVFFRLQWCENVSMSLLVLNIFSNWNLFICFRKCAWCFVIFLAILISKYLTNYSKPWRTICLQFTLFLCTIFCLKIWLVLILESLELLLIIIIV